MLNLHGIRDSGELAYLSKELIACEVTTISLLPQLEQLIANVTTMACVALLEGGQHADPPLKAIALPYERCR